jgi:hypothetical protein
LEAQAEKARQVTQTEARAQAVVLQAKPQSDAMQYTPPLKQPCNIQWIHHLFGVS